MKAKQLFGLAVTTICSIWFCASLIIGDANAKDYIVMNKQEALAIATAELLKHPEQEFVIVNDKISEYDFGWVVPFVSRKWQETGDIKYATPGASPIIVNRFGVISHVSFPVTRGIDNYERWWRKNNY